MKYKLAKAAGLNEPIDGYTPEEKELESVISNQAALSLYAKLPTARQKFIVSMHFELGYSQELIAEMLGIKQPTLREEIELIKMVLKGYRYTPRKFRDGMKATDILKMCHDVMVLQKAINRHLEEIA